MYKSRIAVEGDSIEEMMELAKILEGRGYMQIPGGVKICGEGMCSWSALFRKK